MPSAKKIYKTITINTITPRHDSYHFYYNEAIKNIFAMLLILIFMSLILKTCLDNEWLTFNSNEIRSTLNSLPAFILFCVALVFFCTKIIILINKWTICNEYRCAAFNVMIEEITLYKSPLSRDLLIFILFHSWHFCSVVFKLSYAKNNLSFSASVCVPFPMCRQSKMNIIMMKMIMRKTCMHIL